MARVLQDPSGILNDVFNVVREDRTAHLSGFGPRLIRPDGRAKSILVGLILHLTNLSINIYDLVSATAVVVGIGFLPSLAIRVPIGYVVFISVATLTLEEASTPI